MNFTLTTLSPVLSNATYYDGKLDLELHPAFDTLFRLSKEHELKKSTIEPSESTDFTNKKTLPKKCFNNGGTDEARVSDYWRFTSLNSLNFTNVK